MLVEMVNIREGGRGKGQKKRKGTKKYLNSFSCFIGKHWNNPLLSVFPLSCELNALTRKL